MGPDEENLQNFEIYINGRKMELLGGWDNAKRLRLAGYDKDTAQSLAAMVPPGHIINEVIFEGEEVRLIYAPEKTIRGHGIRIPEQIGGRRFCLICDQYQDFHPVEGCEVCRVEFDRPTTNPEAE